MVVDSRNFAEQVIEILTNGEFTDIPLVLIVEDSITIAGILKKAFESKGYHADIVINAQDAEKIFNHNIYDVAIIDYHLPDNMGDTLLEKFHRQNPECICLMMTTNQSPRFALEWMEKGAWAYLRKPFEPDYLIELCSRARRERSLLNVQNLLEIRTRELKESEERYRLIVDTSNEGIWLMDKDHFIKYTNRTMAEMMGYTESDFTGKRLEDFIFAEDIAYHNELMKNRHAGQDEIYERRLKKKDGSELWTLVSAKALKNSDGIFGGSFGMFTDITQRKLAEQERERLQSQLNHVQKMESIGRLAGGVAHDLNNMLSVIIGNTEIAIDNLESKSVLDELQEILKAAERSTNLTRQLLAFARKQVITPIVLDLNRSVNDMLNMLGRIIGEDIELTWNPKDGLWSIQIDPTQIDQILANLCVNGRDAINGVGKMAIKTDNVTFNKAFFPNHPDLITGNYVLLAVSDSGCGMDKDTLENIFEPFFTTKEIGKGTGLGLATVYGIVQQNNGLINVESYPGHGTTFSIYLPQHIDKLQQNQHGSQTDQKGDSTGSETILLVEDEPSILKLTKIILEKMGYKLLTASTPGEAIDIAKSYYGRIHLLITDVVMPEMNGRDLAKNILSIYPDIKRLFMSGYTADVISRHGVLDAGVHFIQKPFSKHELLLKLKEALE